MVSISTNHVFSISVKPAQTDFCKFYSVQEVDLIRTFSSIDDDLRKFGNEQREGVIFLDTIYSDFVLVQSDS